jgi:hypothetical protein
MAREFLAGLILIFLIGVLAEPENVAARVAKMAKAFNAEMAR